MLKIKQNVGDKEPFVFTYTQPSLDWYETVKVEIKPDDYTYFHLEMRYGSNWYLTGVKFIHDPYKIEEKDLGNISNSNLIKFIKWAKTERGSKITSISAISGDFDILSEISKIVEKVEENGNG